MLNADFWQNYVSAMSTLFGLFFSPFLLNNDQVIIMPSKPGYFLKPEGYLVHQPLGL